ncbi:4'-phosphopantetheinyl transferase family protein [Streptomyces sp. NPDC001339]|uniref:4'-phosphopantetheinyl transferase family protein n=1 Tax=Streptomyces sp. NPDC001339 TaxID=3364563 RepID=UPI003683471F
MTGGVTDAGYPPDGTVHVWRIPLSGPPHMVARLAALLGPEERQRGARALPDDRRRFLLAHGAARSVLGGYLGLPPERLRYSHGRWGKPALDGHPQLCFNLSHSADLALLAVAARRPVGIDVERIRPADRSRSAGRWFPAAEADFVRAAAGPAQSAARYARLWTRKEAWVKAAGNRMVNGLRLPVGTGPDADDGTPLTDPEGRVPGHWSLYGVPAGEGYAAALAVAARPSAAPVRVEVRQWRTTRAACAAGC